MLYSKRYKMMRLTRKHKLLQNSFHTQSRINLWKKNNKNIYIFVCFLHFFYRRFALTTVWLSFKSLLIGMWISIMQICSLVWNRRKKVYLIFFFFCIEITMHFVLLFPVTLNLIWMVYKKTFNSHDIEKWFKRKLLQFGGK